MTKTKRVFLSGVNIVTHPHNIELYKKIITEMVTSRYSINIGGSHKLMLGTIDDYECDSKNVIFGRIYRFTDININDKWFDISSNKEAKRDDLKDISIGGLRRNRRKFRHSKSSPASSVSKSIILPPLWNV